MISVSDNENMIIVKNSKFICILRHVDSINDIDDIFNYVKDKYKDATHYCYAYIINNISKCSDDGEPSGTAGIPMLEVLKKNNLNNVLCIVVRYFGKILLGASGLVRAYSNAVTECLYNHIIKLEPGYNILLKFNYNNLKQIDYFLKNSIILNKKFEKNVIYLVNVTKDIYDNLVNSNLCDDIIINRDIYL